MAGGIASPGGAGGWRSAWWICILAHSLALSLLPLEDSDPWLRVSRWMHTSGPGKTGSTPGTPWLLREQCPEVFTKVEGSFLQNLGLWPQVTGVSSAEGSEVAVTVADEVGMPGGVLGLAMSACNSEGGGIPVRSGPSQCKGRLRSPGGTPSSQGSERAEAGDAESLPSHRFLQATTCRLSPPVFSPELGSSLVINHGLSEGPQGFPV